MQPLWEQSISFKQALAIAAVQKRRFDEEIKQLKHQNAELEQQIHHLKLEIDKYKAAASPELLLAACFNSASPSSAEEGESSVAASDFSIQLETLAISATLWTRASEILPPNTHGFLCKTLEYSEQRRKIGGRHSQHLDDRATPSGDVISPSSSSSPSFLTAGTPTPTQALIQLSQDIITAPVSPPPPPQPLSTFSSFPLKKMEATLLNAASCLGQLCKHPDDCLTLQDFSLLQEFISKLLTITCCRKPEKESSERKIDRPPSLQNSLSLLEALQSSCGTGYLVLGCAAHTLQKYIQRLRGLVTGELEQQQLPLQLPPPPPPSLRTAASRNPSTSEIRVEEQGDEASLVLACGKIARVLQTCLKNLPSWSLELPFSEDFLREIAAAVWDVSSMSEVIAPAHPEIAKQGQRCAALLVSALQHMSSSSSRDDCGTIIE